MEGLFVSILLVAAIVAIVKASTKASKHARHRTGALPPLDAFSARPTSPPDPVHPDASPKSGDGTARLAQRLEEQTTSADPALRSRARQALWRLQQRLRPERPDSRSSGPGPGSSVLGPGSGATGPHPEAAAPAPAPVHSRAHAPETVGAIPRPRAVPPRARPEPTPAASAGVPEAPTGWDLLAALEAIVRQPRFAPERKERIAALAGGEADFVLVVNAVQRTTSAEGAFAEGRMATGLVRGSSLPVGVRFPADATAEVEGWSRGVEVDLRARFVAWDGIFNRPVFEGRPR